jgi:hypothetical protein
MDDIKLGWRHWTIIAITFAVVLAAGINHGIWRPDEPYMAGICSEMVRTQNFAVPMLNGKPFLEKPPLYYATAAVSGIIFGSDNDVSFRIVSIIFSAMTLLAVFLVMRKRKDTTTALLSALVLASMWEYFRISRWILVDISLVFGVTLSMLSWLVVSEGKKVKRYALVFGLGVAVSFMAKGFVGPAIIAAGVAADIIRRRDFRLLYKCRPDIMIIFILIPVALWIAALWSKGGWPFVREVIIVNNLMRFSGAKEAAALGHQHNIFYYFEGFPGTLVPWTLIFIPALIASIRKFRENPYIAWLIGPFILLSIASTKRNLYLAPLLPACALMIAEWLQTARKAKWEDIIMKFMWALIIIASVVPFAGIFLGVPVLGAVMGIISIGLLIIIEKDKTIRRTSLAFALSLCIAMGSVMSVYYKYWQPREDYIPLTKQALALAGNNQVRMIADDEIFEGIVPMLTGKNCENIDSAEHIRIPGYYIWSDDKHDNTLKQLKSLNNYKLLYDKPIGHNKKVRLAYVEPSRNIIAPVPR